jgi:hypothetical protein
MKGKTMNRPISFIVVTALAAILNTRPCPAAETPPPGEGWVSLFNGKDLTGWRTPDGPHDWSVVDGAIDFGGDGTKPGAVYGHEGGHLYTEKSYGDYMLSFEWRFKKDLCHMPDSGIILRGETPEIIHVRHINLWCAPSGSGAIYPGDPNKSMAKVCADKPVGEWNAMRITLRQRKVTVVLNGQTVQEDADFGLLKGDRGPIGIQRHGGYDAENKKWKPLASVIQVRNIRIKELSPDQPGE